MEEDQYDAIDKFLLELKLKDYNTEVIDVNYRRNLRLENASEDKKLEKILKFKKSKGYFEYTPVNGSEFKGVVERAFATGYG